MKYCIGLIIVTLVAIVVIPFFRIADAAEDTVSPSVQLGDTLTLSLENTTNVQWGSKSAGTTQTGTIQANIVANTNWALTVKRSSDSSVSNCGLMGADGNNYIPYSFFKYTSTAGSGSPTGSGVTSTSFSTSDTDVWTGGTAIGSCSIDITYTLQIPATQKAQSYTATHTYTLVAS